MSSEATTIAFSSARDFACRFFAKKCAREASRPIGCACVFQRHHFPLQTLSARSPDQTLRKHAVQQHGRTARIDPQIKKTPYRLRSRRCLQYSDHKSMFGSGRDDGGRRFVAQRADSDYFGAPRERGTYKRGRRSFGNDIDFILRHADYLGFATVLNQGDARTQYRARFEQRVQRRCHAGASRTSDKKKACGTTQEAKQPLPHLIGDAKVLQRAPGRTQPQESFLAVKKRYDHKLTFQRHSIDDTPKRCRLGRKRSVRSQSSQLFQTSQYAFMRRCRVTKDVMQQSVAPHAHHGVLFVRLEDEFRSFGIRSLKQKEVDRAVDRSFF